MAFYTWHNKADINLGMLHTVQCTGLKYIQPVHSDKCTYLGYSYSYWDIEHSPHPIKFLPVPSVNPCSSLTSSPTSSAQIKIITVLIIFLSQIFLLVLKIHTNIIVQYLLLSVAYFAQYNPTMNFNSFIMKDEINIQCFLYTRKSHGCFTYIN